MGAIRKHPNLFFGIAVTLVFLLFSTLRVGFLESLELSVYDLLMRMRGDSKAESDIVLVNIDEPSLTTLGRWPWPRSVLAEGIAKIKAGAPKVVGLSVILSEPEKSEGLVEIQGLTRLFEGSSLAADGEPAAGFLAALSQARDRLDNDRRLATAMTDANDVILPIYFKESGVAASVEADKIPEKLKAQALKVEGGEDSSVEYPMASDVVLPIASFLSASVGLGHINLSLERDGAVRRELPFYEYGGLFIPSYTVRLACAYLSVAPDKTRVIPGRSVDLGGLVIPITVSSDLLVSFKGPAGSFPSVSFSDVVTDKVQARAFANKLVVVTPAAPGLGSLISTPVGTLTQGEFSANAIWAMLNRKFVSRPGWSGLFELLLILLLGAAVTFVLPKLKAGVAAGAFAGAIAVLCILDFTLFVSQGLWVRMTYPILLLVAGYIGVVSIQYLVTQTGKDKATAESAETNRMLGVSFQNQGLLDMAFEKFRRVPVDNEMKSLLYTLALDYERKRQLNKAAAVYEYIEETDPKYKDVAVRKTKLMQASETMVFGQGMLGGTNAAGQSIITDGSDTKPTLGRYEVIRMLGKGAMGVVYLGQDPRINRTTAIKTVRFTDDFPPEEAEDMKKKFFREAESAGTLNHPNIVTIYDAGEEQELAYIAMEYLEGTDLDSYIKPDKLLPMRKVIEYVADVADALGFAHAKGIVHRDVKPANIMLLKSGVVKVTDFGIARIQASSATATGVVKGTPYYMSPEQIQGQKVDGRSDIFSLGVMLYQMLTGKLPFYGDSIAALMHQIMNVQHPDPRQFNPNIYKPLCAIIDKSLEKDREKRYQKAEQMAAHLRELGKKIDIAVAQKQKQASQG
ncbi:MAG: serine/threonine-protein kinase [Thermodesulfobacteriota bacterium]